MASRYSRQRSGGQGRPPFRWFGCPPTGRADLGAPPARRAGGRPRNRQQRRKTTPNASSGRRWSGRRPRRAAAPTTRMAEPSSHGRTDRWRAAVSSAARAA